MLLGIVVDGALLVINQFLVVHKFMCAAREGIWVESRQFIWLLGLGWWTL